VGDSLVDTSTLFARDGSVVDNVNAAPTAVLGSSYAALAVRVILARIVNNFLASFKGLLNRNLVGNELKHLLSIPLAVGSISTLEQHEDTGTFQTSHSLVEAG